MTPTVDAATRAVARYATDPADHNQLMQMLGLIEDTPRTPENRNKTHCPAGHEYTEANTYRAPGDGHRLCRTCRTARLKAKRTGRGGLQGMSAMNAARTHCQRGHEFTEDNTYRTPNGRRNCRACRNTRRAADRAAAKQATT